jgi:hypothetical protein
MMVSRELRTRLDYVIMLMGQEGVKWDESQAEAAIPYEKLTDAHVQTLIDAGYAALREHLDKENERLAGVAYVPPAMEERQRIAKLIREHAHNLFWISNSHTALRIADAIENDRWPEIHIDFRTDVEYDKR